MDERDLAQVEAAFQTLLEVVSRECDADTAWTVECARVDVLAILSGEWSDVAMRKRCGGKGDAPDEGGLILEVLTARTVEAFDTAATRLLIEATFDDEGDVRQARIGIDPAWRPFPTHNETMLEINEAMLTALEIYGEKRSGALGRGASQSEAETFALVEARRAYRLLVEGGGS